MKFALTLLVFALLLAACAGSGNDGEATPAATLGSGPVENEAALTPAAEVEPGETPIIEDVPAPSPVSPAGDAEVITAPVLAGTLLGYDVAGPDGQVGAVTGVVADLLSGQVRHISLRTIGTESERTVLLPWGTFQIVVFPAGDNLAGAEPAPQVWLENAADVAGAPQFEESDLDNPADLTANWDAESSAYWSERVPGLPATGTEERAEGLAYLRDERFNQMEYPLVDTQGEELGEIEDMVIGEGGVFSFGILDPRGALAEGRDLIVVGWKAMSWLPEEGQFVLNVPIESLKSAPDFSPSDLPDTTLPGWDADWIDYWQDVTAQSGSAVATPTEEGTRLPVKAAALLEQQVVDRSGNEVGQLVDWWMHIQGQSEYAVIQEQGRLVLLPWMALDWDAEEEQMVLNIDPTLLIDAPSFVNVSDMDSTVDWRPAVEQYWREFMPVVESASTTATPLTPGDAPREEVRVMRIITEPVFGPAGENLGEVADMIFNPDGQAAYVALQSGEDIRLVPWMNFEYNLRDGQLKYLDDEVRLSEAPATDMENLNLSDANWDAQLRTYWGMK